MSKSAYRHEPHITKKKQLSELIDLLQQHKTVGITKVENITAKSIQRLRTDMRQDAILRLAKNTLMLLALKELAKKDKGISKLVKYINGSCAFILTNGNPFKVANFLEKKKIPTPAKEGQIAPKEIVITARDTGFAPGPVIGELQSVGLKTRIDGGTIKIIEDAVVCQSGDKISRTLANVLGRLGIEPFDAGLSVDAIYSGGSLLVHDELIVDFDGIMNDLVKAHQNAFSLSLEMAIPTKDNLSELIGRARRSALNLAIETSFITPETASNVLAKTQLEAMILAKLIASKDPSVIPQEILSAAQSTVVKTQPKEKKEEVTTPAEEEEEEEDSGMGSLFG
ncbi:MAG: 50S ribosomal protein L10 [Candidatus Heimdallarchaeota archaeon]|nr:50S ribosomal protein L10 [Candidatus Heimdallarchaeota archaeon]MBY8994048.1 50S ribosomal protein L10 [Candidatus Heimdallarchaeota archaeon]